MSDQSEGKEKKEAFRRSKQIFLNDLITFNNLLLEEVTQRLTVVGDTCYKGFHSNSTKLRCTLTDICKAHEEKDFFELTLGLRKSPKYWIYLRKEINPDYQEIG